VNDEMEVQRNKRVRKLYWDKVWGRVNPADAARNEKTVPQHPAECCRFETCHEFANFVRDPTPAACLLHFDTGRQSATEVGVHVLAQSM
jgi:hypothetical protein